MSASLKPADARGNASGAERLASGVSEGVLGTRSCMKAPGNGTRAKMLLER